MTRRFDGQVFCPNCRCWHTAETAFERWMRGQEALDSSLGIVRFDLDVLVHRYLTPTDKKGTRDLQCVQFVEVKTHGGDVRPAQQDSFSMLSQVLRNRRRNVHRGRRGRHSENHVAPVNVFSLKLKRNVRLRMFGGHLLQLSHNDPTDSEWIKWDYKPITAAQLVSVLRFDLDPDTLREMDWRRRHSNFEDEGPVLFRIGPADTSAQTGLPPPNGAVGF